MKVFLAIILLGSFAKSYRHNWYPISQNFINKINSLNTTWTAGPNFDNSTPLNYFKNLAGVNYNSYKYRLKPRKNDLKERANLPGEFDSRKQWPECETIGDINDQANCGDCWAFGAVEAMSDRICIHSSKKLNIRLSVEELTTCCIDCGYGCAGGFPAQAWKFWKSSGIVTGGKYGSREGCQPFEIPPCTNSSSDCDSTAVTPICKTQCTNDNYSRTFWNDLHYGEEVYSVPNDEGKIREEIYTNGPVEATFMVYEDFLSYKSGVYQPVMGVKLSEHAVKILGWGSENNTPYWLVANSWNTTWGDKGYFKIIRGVNSCGIEDSVNAGLPRLKETF